MVNVFHLYFGVFHIVSLVLAVSVVLFYVFLQRTQNIVYRFMNAMILGVLGHFVYEDFFTFYYRLSGYGVDAYTVNGTILYLGVTTIIILLAYIANNFNRFIYFGEYNLVLLFLLVVYLNISLFILYDFGWYAKLYIWFNGGFDPHNFLWALSKFLGLYLFTPLLVKFDD